MEIRKRQLARVILIFIFLLAAAAIIPAILSVNASGTGSYTITEGDTRQNEIQRGVTLNCWNWSYINIETNMGLIYEMGFTSVQTLPVQPEKESAKASALGTEAEFESMCKKAHDYGIKVIVDVEVDNMANQSTNYVIDYLEECIDLGVDGFCFDSANCIGEYGKDFWATVIDGTTFYASSTRGINLYCYGVVLGKLDTAEKMYISDYTRYMSITDNEKGETLREYIKSGDAANAVLSDYYKETNAFNLVLWAESKDTYAQGDSSNVPTNVINKTWALLAARADAMGIYFARPYNMESKLGASDITGWANKEVAAVNDFHNAFSGQSEKLASENGIVYCERGTSGIVLVNCQGANADVDIAVSMKNGNYVDHITGNIFTVSNGRLCGEIGDTGIAVVYNPVREPKIYVSMESGIFTTDTLELKIELSNAEVGTYQVGRGEAVSFVGEAKITIDRDEYKGKSINVKVTAKLGSKETSKTFTYTKGQKSENVAYIALPEAIGKDVYCYVYDAEKVTLNNGNWPGAKMTFVKDGIYMYEVPDAIENPRVVFTTADGNRYPDDGEQGFVLAGNMVLQDGKWEQYVPEVVSYGKVVVYHVDEAGKTISTLDTLEGKVGDEYQTSVKSIYGYNFVKVDGNPNGKFADGQIEVKYIYSKIKVENTRTAYIKKPSTWGTTMYCYAYSADEESVENAKWPGVEMTYVANGIYKYEVPADISNPLVIFNDNRYQYPGSMQRGLELPNDMIYASGIWKEFSENLLSNENVAYIMLNQNWGAKMYCYAYSSDDGMINAYWPGVEMEHVSGNLYKYKVPSNITNPLVIFTDGNNQYPGSMKPGLPLVGSMIFKNGKWEDYK